MPNPLWTHDRKAVKGFSGVVGVDEAGRGCLAGPVVAGAALLPVDFFGKASNRKRCGEVNDSKQLNESKREKLFDVLQTLREANELWLATGEASVEEIESENVVGATCLAMRRAMERLAENCDDLWSPRKRDEADGLFASNKNGDDWLVLVDGRFMKRLPFVHEGLVKGDSLSLAVAMASIAAKVTRDRKMRKLAKLHPSYDFASNKGYGAPKHLQALRAHGPTMHHRPRFLQKILRSNEPSPEESRQTRLSFD